MISLAAAGIRGPHPRLAPVEDDGTRDRPTAGTSGMGLR